MSDTNAPVDPLESLANHRAFVLGAYFIAFAPWAVISNLDFISEKWRTIRRTRQLGRMHLICSVFPVFYLAVYAEAQRRSDDSKELGAALVAFFVNLYHLLRTLFGNMQVDAFERWASDLANCMRAIRVVGESPSRAWEEEDDSKGNTIDEVLMVNNNVVDNELGGNDVTVQVSSKNVWTGLKQGRLVPSEWLVTDDVWLSTVRWSGAFLCGMGSDWNCYVNSETMKKFFSLRMSFALSSLDNTTWNITEEGEEGDVEDSTFDDGSNENRVVRDGCRKNQMTLRSMRELNLSFRSNLPASGCVAFGTRLPPSGSELDTNLAYNFEFDSLCGSFPTYKKNPWNSTRENMVVDFVYQILLVKYVGVKKLKQIRQSYERGKFLTDKLWSAAFKLLREQCDTSRSVEDGELQEMFSHLYQIPIFPYRRQMIALWDECPNHRVLQASVHEDNTDAMINADQPSNAMSEAEEFDDDQMDVYEYYKHIGGLVREHYRANVIYGIVAESVRSFLAEWLVSSGRDPDWEPTVPLEYELKFRVSEVVAADELDISKSRRLLWECQRALQNEVARTYRGHENLPSSAPLMMLFISAFPQVDIREIASVDDSGSDRGEKKSSSNTSTVPSSHSEVNVSERMLRLSTEFVPSDVTVLIKQNLNTRQTTLRLTSDCHGARFIWEDWVNATIGLMKGMVLKGEEGAVRNVGMLPLQRAKLREPMLELCPLHVSLEDITVQQSGIARVWTGWPPFDWRVCKFEVDEWLYALELDSRYSQVPSFWNFSISEGVQDATQAVKSIIQTVANENEQHVREH